MIVELDLQKKKKQLFLKLQKKDLLSVETKLIEKYLILLTSKNVINLILRKRNDKTIKKNCSKTKNYRKFKIVHIKIAIMEHPKTSQKLSKTIKETKKASHVGSGENSHSHLYSEKRGMKKRKNKQETN